MRLINEFILKLTLKLMVIVVDLKLYDIRNYTNISFDNSPLLHSRVVCAIL